MFFKIADTSINELRYYPFVEVTVGNETAGNESVGGPVVTPGNETNVTVPTNDTNVTAPTDNETNATAPAVGTTPGEPSGATPANNTTEEKEGTPGFTGVILGISGLLAVLYLVRRNN
jgi:hypothetical protein